MNQPHNKDDIEADYGEMYDGDLNEEFDEENTKDTPIPSTTQYSSIPSTTQYSLIPMPRKKIKYQRNCLNLAKFKNCQMEIVEKMA